MRNILYCAFAVMALLFGCNKHEDPEVTPDDPYGRVRVEIDTRSLESSNVATKSTETDLSGNIVVLVFDKTNPNEAILKQIPAEASVVNGKINVLLYKEETESFIYVMANISDANKKYLLALPAGHKLSDISKELTESVGVSGLKLPLVASGWSSGVDKIVKGGSSNNITVTMVRIVARVDVNSTISGFQIHGVKLLNGAQEGYVMQQRILPNFGDNDVVPYDKVLLPVPSTSVTGQIYCYENRGRGIQINSPYPTRVVVLGKRVGAIQPTYYAIDIIYRESNDLAWHIERNKQYTINIRRVESDGYATFDEAMNGESFNSLLDADIVVTDPYAYEIVTNGEQYLAATNSEFVVYPAINGEGASDLLAGTISYTCAPSWGMGKIIVPPGITLFEGIDRLDVQDGQTPMYRDIVIKKIDPSFTSGVMSIEIGNLIKKITIRVMPATVRTGQVTNDYKCENPAEYYKVGEIINPSNQTSWLKLSSSEFADGSTSLNDKISNPVGGIFAHVAPFLSRGTPTQRREASFYVGGDTKDHRIKVHIQQDTYDILNESKQITPNSFVGTFHRWDQTGERIIRMDAGVGVSWWRVIVAEGTDFIVLSKDKSPDSGIAANPFVAQTPTYATDDMVEANCQVNSRTISLFGSTKDIYFRVGLTSKLSSSQAKPRYGMITVAYGTSSTDIKGVHNIFVRQGEEPDFIMRPSDPSTSIDFNSIVRHNASRIGVYNLADDITNQSSESVMDRGTKGYNFVNYPSQGGYYFLASGTQAVSPVANGVLSALVVPPVFDLTNGWKASWETCPKGYRRPSDGKARKYSLSSVTDEVKNSEVRQSLWAQPSGGAERNDHTNSVVGYLADGYFDRNQIQQIDNPTQNMINGVVNPRTINAAYAGTLVFNPNTLASIFLPFSGSYNPLTGLGQRGSRGSFQLATPGELTKGWITSYGDFSGNDELNMYSRSNVLEAYSIRCLKDENHHFDTGDSQVETPGDGGTSSVVTLLYDTNSASLEALINSRYDNQIMLNATTIYVKATKQMSSNDYAFLNRWASDPSKKMNHVILRGIGSINIPKDAFTSSSWMSIKLVDAEKYADGAFASSLVGLKELSLAYMDDMTLTKEAFKFDVSIGKKIALNLGSAEYNKHISGEPAMWRDTYWSTITLIK